MNIGLRFLEMKFADENMKVHLYYPSNDAEISWQCGPYTLTAAFDGKVATGKFPLVVISHGTGSSPLVWRDLARHLSAQNLAVACIEHPHNNRTQNDRADTLQNLLDRPQHIIKVITELKSFPWIDSDQTHLVGHSLGAFSILVAAGAKGHTKHQIKYDTKTTISESTELKLDSTPEIQSLVLLNPATTWFLTEGSLADIKASILMMTGTKDNFTPRFHGEIVEREFKEKLRWIEVENAGHFSFMSPFPQTMISKDFSPGNDPIGFDRPKYQKDFMRIILEFLVHH